MKQLPGLALILLLLGACGSEESQPGSVVDQFMADPAALDRGQALFIGSCANFCHGLLPEEAEANDASFLFDCQWDYGGDDEDIFNVVTDGIPDTRMVGFGNNFPEGEDDLWKIIAYIRSNQDPCPE